MAPEPYHFARPARRPGAFVIVGVAIGLIVLFIYVIDAHYLIVTITALAVAPAIWDIWKGAVTTLSITGEAIAWESGPRTGSVPLDEIDRAVLATTLDFSQRATLHLRNGQRVRIPPECLPGGRILDAQFEQRGISHRRSLFSF